MSIDSIPIACLVGYSGSFASISLCSSTVSIALPSSLVSSVDVGQHVVQASEDRQQIWNHSSPAQHRQHLHMREGGRANARPVRADTSIADQVVAVTSLCPLDDCHRLTRRDDGTPTHSEEVVNERLYILHGSRLWRRRGQGMLRIAGAPGHIV